MTKISKTIALALVIFFITSKLNDNQHVVFHSSKPASAYDFKQAAFPLETSNLVTFPRFKNIQPLAENIKNVAMNNKPSAGILRPIFVYTIIRPP